MQIIFSTNETKWLDDNRGDMSRQAYLRMIVQDKMNTTPTTEVTNDKFTTGTDHPYSP